MTIQHNKKSSVLVIGGGLAGCEAAWQLAERGVDVSLAEMRPNNTTQAHESTHLGELVCSNSLKSMQLPAAAATLKYELAQLGSFVLAQALETRVAAGMALAVNRDEFAAALTQKIEQHPCIELMRKEITDLTAPELECFDHIIVATGPLTSDALGTSIADVLGANYLAFFDAAAPIVETESLDLEQLVSQSRFDKGQGEYLNAMLTKEQYYQLVDDLVNAERVILKDFEKRELFSACQPVEEVARSGADALRYGALKPLGLCDPTTEKRPYAAIQLRAENTEKSAWNMVGFQTNLTFAEQDRVLRTIPGFANAQFVRHGVMHRNTFINAPAVLGNTFEIPSRPTIRFAGQITGTEGYTEAIASGLFAALNVYAHIKHVDLAQLPQESVFGALVSYATNAETKHYQPMHVNYGIMPALETRIKDKRLRYAAYSQRALDAVACFMRKREELAFLPSICMPQLEETE